MLSLIFPLGWEAHAGAPAPDAAASETRYGLFDLLDHRSIYGKGVFPEPFLNDDSDLEESELRFDWLNTTAGGLHTNVFSAEYEQGFGPATFELKVPFERNSETGVVTEGIGNIEIAGRLPAFQYVSAGGAFDTTFGVALELGIPVHSSVSRTTELVPKLFNDLKLGRFTLQSIIGYSTVLGVRSLGGGTEKLEFGCTLGYTIPHEVLPIPGVRALIPVFELSGETQLNKENVGDTSILALAGVRANLKAIGRVQPRVGFGVVFPLDGGAFAETHLGFATSVIFEF